MVEKRRHPRIPMTGWAEIRIEGTDETLNGYITNVSLGGIALYAKKVLKPGSIVLLSLHFFGQRRFESVKELKGEVVSGIQEQEISCVGIQFLKPISKENEPVLYSFLEEDR